MSSAVLSGLGADERPAAGVLLSPYVDMTLVSASMRERAARDPISSVEALRAGSKLYLRGASANHPDASPLFAELSGLPPLLIHVGSEEVLYDDAVHLYERALDSGIAVELHVWEEMIHGFQVLTWLRESRLSIEEIGAFCRERAVGKAT